MTSSRSLLRLVSCAIVACSAAACADFYAKREYRHAGSMVEYLYPKEQKAEAPSIPHLSLPLRVGVAFVPETKGSFGVSRLGEKDRMDLLARISAEFKGLSFVKEIEIIPSNYLTPGGGFANLDQLRTMYGIDVIALVSYDQVQHTDEGMASLTYWTIVGAYVVKGEKNDTSTMVDAAVFDIKSRKMLFRAPGVSHVKGSATPVNLTEQLRADSMTGFRLASDDLVVNLKGELERFQAKVKDMPQDYAVSRQPGYTGGGSLDGAFALFLLAAGSLALWAGRRP